MRVPKKIIAILRKGGVGILPTDTLYGLVGQARNKKTVERIYRVRKRNPKKPFIILISEVKDVSQFGIKLQTKDKKKLTQVWAKPISVVLETPGSKFQYLHRGKNSLAFRRPQLVWLRRLLKQTGPLVAPSANPEGKEPAYRLNQAKQYFKSQVDFYTDGGARRGKPSTIIRFQDPYVIERLGSVPESFIKKIWE